MASPQKLHFQLKYLPMLDGVRGLAVLAVMGFHARLPLVRWGYIGVDVFFALSGFLITSILLQEWSEERTVDLKNFYARRALRLLPALFVLLLFSLLPLNEMDSGERLKAGSVALFYSTNWVRAFAPDFPMGGLSHTWSLSIEEQFYLLWPLALLAMLRFESLRRRMHILVGAGILSCILCRIGLLVAGRAPVRLYNGLDTRADSLLMGALLSIVLAFGLRGSTYAPSATTKKLLVIAGVPVLVLLFLSKWNDPFMFVAGYSVVSIASCATILSVVRPSANPLKRVLMLAPLVWTGKISYGLYLWHYPLFKLVRLLGMPNLLAWPCMFGATFLIATLSFKYVERPFLRMKKRFQAHAAPPTDALVVSRESTEGAQA